MLSGQADTYAYHGRLVQARDYSRRAVESAVLGGSKETAALWRVTAGLREAEFGNKKLRGKTPMRRCHWSPEMMSSCWQH